MFVVYIHYSAVPGLNLPAGNGLLVMLVAAFYLKENRIRCLLSNQQNLHTQVNNFTKYKLCDSAR